MTKKLFFQAIAKYTAGLLLVALLLFLPAMRFINYQLLFLKNFWNQRKEQKEKRVIRDKRTSKSGSRVPMKQEKCLGENMQILPEQQE